MSNKIMLIACGSFSPPTPMHFRMFEIARDHFNQFGTHQVVGGIASPVHDAYGKKGLVSATHRCLMVKLALQTSDWIKLSDWEVQQEGWSRTKVTLQYHQNYLNSYIKDLNGTSNYQIPSWMPNNVKQIKEPVQVKLLCGADLLESFATPGLWEQEDLEAILGQHGIVVISRSGSNPEQFIFNSDLLSKYRSNITIVTNWVTNDVSSTLARKFLGRGLSVKFLLDDLVTEYIKKNQLYGSQQDVGKFIMPPTQMMMITPVTPENPTFNDSYVLIQNERNEQPFDSSMDQTDSQSTSSLQKVFCCGENSRPFLNRPGGAVQIITDASGMHSRGIGVLNEETVKVGQGTIVNRDTRKSIKEHKIPKLELNDSVMGASQNSPQSPRLSPNRSYSDMIKFVFTEHGIKVISDKEYVV